MRSNYINLQRLLKTVVSLLAERLSFGVLQPVLFVAMHFLTQGKLFPLTEGLYKEVNIKPIFSVWTIPCSWQIT